MPTTDLRHRLHSISLFATVTLALSAAPRVEAAEPDRAETLFQKARDLMGVNDFATACPLLEEAYSLDHGGGTLLALALCYEGAGRPATALRRYRESLSQAVAANRPDRVMLAESHVQKLEAAVPRIVVHVTPPEPAGLTITLDGTQLDRAAIVAGAPVDPGKHELVASAPDMPSWRTMVDVTAVARSLVVDVPAWSSPAPPPDRIASARPVWPRTVGIVIGSVGLVSLGVGTGFGVETFHEESRSKPLCPGNVCSQDGYDFNHAAKRDAIVSDVTLVVGGVAVVAGLALVLRYTLKPKGVTQAVRAWSEGGSVATSW